MKKVYLADEFNIEKIESLEQGNNYLIGAECGAGKTTWVEEILIPHCIKNDKTILLLIHRKSLRNQVLNSLKNIDCCLDNVEIMLYQEVEQQLLINRFANNYDFIVCDEIHYLVTDASFNRNTEVVFDMLNKKSRSINILLTGTPNPLAFCKWDKKPVTLVS